MSRCYKTFLAMALDRQEKYDLEQIMNEFEEETERFDKMKEIGNSKGGNKDIYRGKYEAFNRARIVLDRYMRFHGLKEQSCDG